MQQSRSALSLFLNFQLKFGTSSSSKLIRVAVPGGSFIGLRQQHSSSSSSNAIGSVSSHTPAGSGLGSPLSPGSASSLDVTAESISATRVSSIAERRLTAQPGSDLGNVQRTKAAVTTEAKTVRESAAKLRAKLKATAEREKVRAKLQKAKALVQKAKAEKIQQKLLLGKRAPSAWTLFIKDHIKTLDHLPFTSRLARISVMFKELTPEQRQPYMDASSKLRKEQAIHRAAVRGTKPVYIPSNAYMLYKQDKSPVIKAANRSSTSVDIFKLVSKQWRLLSESDKQALNARVVILKAAAAGVIPAVSPVLSPQ